ncbi:Afadin and alpha-actinin-binding-domain-containing protein [Scheffersomyces xylosifermentans]|uniref:Afadin and alpha-actinin-binding-domain-containing protein n=1 Tax=Scheffersomyces xylosifermentans TaxID=1304137 RepID=UPI00315D2D14
MSGYLDTEPIHHASEIINSMLLSRAYTDQKLSFVTIDWEELVKDQILDNEEVPRLNELKVTETLYNNDRAIVNIIHSLLVALDRNRGQQKLSNQTISQKDSTIAKLKERVDVLESKLKQSETKISKLVQFDQNELNKRITDLTRHNRIQSQDLNKLKNWAGDIKTKYKVELKKKDLEIDELKNKLLEKRNLSSTLTYGIPLSTPTTTDDSTTINANIIYNNNPIIDNTKTIGNGVTSLTVQSVVNQEYTELSSNLTAVIESLASENYKFSKFMEAINEYYYDFNNQLTDSKFKDMSAWNLPNPSNIIDLQAISSVDSAIVQQYLDELESFDVLAKPILNNIYKFYHNMTNLIRNLDTTATYSPEGDDGRAKHLEKELEIMTRNWKDALKTAENWKTIHQAHLTQNDK